MSIELSNLATILNVLLFSFSFILLMNFEFLGPMAVHSDCKQGCPMSYNPRYLKVSPRSKYGPNKYRNLVHNRSYSSEYAPNMLPAYSKHAPNIHRKCSDCSACSKYSETLRTIWASKAHTLWKCMVVHTWHPKSVYGPHMYHTLEP